MVLPYENMDYTDSRTLLSELTDIAITNVVNGQILRYDDTNEVWENITPTYLDGANLPDNFLIKSVITKLSLVIYLAQQQQQQTNLSLVFQLTLYLMCFQE